MLRRISLLILVASLSTGECGFCQSPVVNSFRSFTLEARTNIRAIKVLNDSVVWFAGSGGMFGFTDNAGATWMLDTLQIEDDTMIPEFRSIALTNDHTVFLMNAGSPAFIWRSDDFGVTWKIVYDNSYDDIFFDALKFSDAKNGIAVGDPIRACFQIITTADSGKTWNSIVCNNIAEALGGEACFASSNSSVTLNGKSVWFGTGGLHSRVFASADGGEHWKAFLTPILEGSELTGIFSLDFYDRYTGIAAGGNYDEKSSTALTVAITGDEGKTWKSVDEENAPPFVSCVKYQPNAAGKIIFAACLPGIYFSDDGGLRWRKLLNSSGKAIMDSFYTFEFSSSGKVAWFAGADGKLARLQLK